MPVEKSAFKLQKLEADLILTGELKLKEFIKGIKGMKREKIIK